LTFGDRYVDVTLCMATRFAGWNFGILTLSVAAFWRRIVCARPFDAFSTE
jgi:hypothetical protein